MVDSLAMFFGAKKRRVKSHGTIVVNGRTRKLYKGPNGGVFYKTRSGSTYIDSKFIRKHSPKRSRRASPKRRRRASPKRRRRASPKRRRRSSPKRRRRASPKRRRRASPKRRRRSSPKRRTRWGYGLGQPSLLNMMGPAGLTVMPAM